MVESRERRKLLEVYRSVKPAEAIILQLLSVIYAPITPAELARTALRYNSGLQNIGNTLSSLQLLDLIEECENGVRCQPLLREPLTQIALKNGSFHSFAGVVRDALWHNVGWSENEMRSYEQAVARIRVAVYQGNAKSYEELSAHCLRRFPRETTQTPPISLICDDESSCVWLRTLPKNFLINLLVELLNNSLHRLQPAEHFLELLAEIEQQAPHPLSAITLSAQWIYRGKFSKGLKYAKTVPSYLDFFRAWIDFIGGRTETALSYFDKTIDEKNPPALKSALYLLSLLERERYSEAHYYAQRIAEDNENICSPIIWLAAQIKGPVKNISLPENCSPLAQLFTYLAWYWEGENIDDHARAQLVEFFNTARENNYHWLAVEAAAILSALENNHELTWAAKLANALKTCECTPLINLFKPKASWERPLNALNVLIDSEKQHNVAAANDVRLIWHLSHNAQIDIYELFALEQHVNANGQWGRARKLTWQNLYQTPENYLTDQDKKICSAIVRELREKQTVYELDYDLALVALIGHPLVFLAGNNNIRIEIVSGEPELLILQETNHHLRLRLQPTIGENEKVILARETATRFRVTQIKEIHAQVYQILGTTGRVFPQVALPQIKTIVTALSTHLTIQSEIGGIIAEVEEAKVDQRLYVQLLPLSNGLKIEFLVRPFGLCGENGRGNYYQVGSGASLLISDFEGQKFSVHRDLHQEIIALEKTLALCPALQNAEISGCIYHLFDAIDCLELLLQLQAMPAENLVVEWPQGGKRRIENAPQSLKVKIRRYHEWFTLTGEVKINEELTLSMQELLALSVNSTGRFVKINDEQYLALTEVFRQQLRDLSAYGECEKDGIKIPALAALALNDLATTVDEFVADREWKQLIAKLKCPDDFSVPENFRGELRDYQLNGFKWLANLAAWNFGACLADDMGLGKTVQTLALLLQRAKNGAALVIAPTSVCFNWLQEAEKFAPSLKVILFGADSDRQAVLDDAGKNTLIVCSYALLQQEDEMFTQKAWSTIVLDEAQAIKNSATKRSQTAMKLRGDFRLVTTGTPIENHLGELWNIFNFLNRGLLGNQAQFQARFAAPIEREKDDGARQRLKRLLQPFILRRLKTQVLTELPPRTEIVKTITLSEEELAFYEALRRNAVEKLSALDNKSSRPLQILAEIMRLRRACCNPRLVDANSNIVSSKMTEFGSIVEELLDNNHRALVFSQFVDHLHLVREYLDAQAISYQYLDGSTPEKSRRKIIADFQKGTSDLFLISLKAGGQGLNLTAADYVIHLDPWWNPAVEDQASDRAHRIGQTRPVTIYRLVMQNTIEARIVDLHHYKRELADGILSDSDLSGRVNAEDLLNLIRENTPT